jgi:hypothetical protein
LLVQVVVVDGKLVGLLVLVEDLLVEMDNQDLLEPQLVAHNLLVGQEHKLLMVMVEHYLVALNQDQTAAAPVVVAVDIMVVVLVEMREMVNLAVEVADMLMVTLLLQHQIQ